MAKNTLLVAGPKLQKKLRDLSNGVTNIDLTTAPNVSNRQEIISRSGIGSSKTPTYNGYFTLKDVSAYNEDGTVKEYRVAVCDGETWDAEKQESGDSIVYCNGTLLRFKSVVKTFEKNRAFYVWIKCGYTEKYINKVVILKDASQPQRIGYEYLYVGYFIINTDGTMYIHQEQLSNPINITYTHYTGGFALRPVENNDEEDTVDESKVAVCDGATWDAVQKTSGLSSVSINGYGIYTEFLPSIVTNPFVNGREALYIYVKRSVRGFIVNVVQAEDVDTSQIGTFGYTTITRNEGKQIHPNGLYTVFLYNNACAGTYSIIEDDEGSK